MAFLLALLALSCAEPGSRQPSAAANSKSAAPRDTATLPPLRNDTTAWSEGSTTAVRADGRVVTLSGVRTAAHDTFDRVVFEFSENALPNYHVQYSETPVTQCGSGDVVPLAGAARLEVRLEPANAHDDRGQPTVLDRSRRPRLPTLLELKLTCDFEAVVSWAAGVQTRKPYRVLELRNPARLIVDLAH